MRERAATEPSDTTRTALMLLDASVRPGLTKAEFKSLFRSCSCGLVTTRKAFANHYCRRRVGQLERQRVRSYSVLPAAGHGRSGGDGTAESTDQMADVSGGESTETDIASE